MFRVGVLAAALLLPAVCVVADDNEMEGTEMSEPQFQDKHIGYVELKSTDIDATKSFYGSVFGWTFIDYGPDYVSFANSGLEGGFHKAESVTEGGPLVVIFSTDIESARDNVAEAGGEIVEDIFDFPGGRRFEFLDPSGNRLAVWADPAE